jgi:hypothetical protein
MAGEGEAREPGGLASGFVLLILGAFVLLRTVVRDSSRSQQFLNGMTLVDRILALNGPPGPQSALDQAAVSGNIPNLNAPLNLPGVGPNNPFFTAVRGAASVLGIARGPVHTSEVSYGTNPYYRSLVGAVHSGDARAATTAWNQFAGWLAQQPGIGQGHGKLAAAVALKSQGLYTPFSRLTGVTVSGF